MYLNQIKSQNGRLYILNVKKYTILYFQLFCLAKKYIKIMHNNHKTYYGCINIKTMSLESTDGAKNQYYHWTWTIFWLWHCHLQ